MRRWLRSQKSRKFPWTTPFVADTFLCSDTFLCFTRPHAPGDGTPSCHLSEAAAASCKRSSIARHASADTGTTSPPPLVAAHFHVLKSFFGEAVYSVNSSAHT